jgi:hypothetical protein
MPVTKTTGHSRPFAACTVSRETPGFEVRCTGVFEQRVQVLNVLQGRGALLLVCEPDGVIRALEGKWMRHGSHRPSSELVCCASDRLVGALCTVLTVSAARTAAHIRGKVECAAAMR